MFVENHAGESGGGLSSYNSTPTIRQCTFVGNSAGSGGGAAVYSWDASSHIVIENSILAFNDGGDAVASSGGSVTITCTDIYGNPPGAPVESQMGTNGNISEDPLFCNLIGGDFTLSALSPCAPGANPECGLIGALPVACGQTPTQAISWGAVKALLREGAK